MMTTPASSRLLATFIAYLPQDRAALSKILATSFAQHGPPTEAVLRHSVLVPANELIFHLPSTTTRLHAALHKPQGWNFGDCSSICRPNVRNASVCLVRPNDRRTGGFGASSYLPLTPAKVASPNRQRPLRLDGRNWSSCPFPVKARARPADLVERQAIF
jgi:hypothetical protein